MADLATEHRADVQDLTHWMVRGNGRRPVLSVAVEEVFLEGDSFVAVLHAPGCQQTRCLLGLDNEAHPGGELPG